jgi:hypothetical protein
MDFQALMQIAEQMSIPELERLLIDLNALILRRKTPDIPARERFLLDKIKTTVLGREKTERYQELVYKHEFETITDEEHAEWGQLADEEENIRVQWLTYLVELTQLRDVPLPQLMEDLGLNRPMYA